MRIVAPIGVTLLCLMVPADAAGTQADQQAIATQLLGGAQWERSEALEAAGRLKPEDVGPELRAALFATLRREAGAHEHSYHADKRGETGHWVEDPEFIARVTRAVAQLRDPQAIPALAEALGTGFTAIRALAGFGQAAAPTVIGIVRSATSTHYAVDDGLITLRFMVEGAATRPLSSATLQAIRQAAHQRLTGKQYFTTLWRAIDLAVVLRDQSLTRIVEALATDWNEVVARGIEDAELVERTQKLAAERLAGSPPLPRPDSSLADQLKSASLVDVAAFLARNELSAAFVVNLPKELESARAAAAHAQRRPLLDRGGFGVLANESRPYRWLTIAPGRTADEILHAFSDRKEAARFTVTESARQITMLRETSAGICTGKLRQRVRTDHTGSDVLELISAIVHDATGATVPSGYVGSCLPLHVSVTSPLAIEAGQTLEEALNAVVALAPGTVWMAVQSSDGQCSVGVIRTAAHGGICMAGVTNHLGR